MNFSLVVAMDKNRGIGLSGRLPWKLSGDMRFFRDLTTCPDALAVEQCYGLAPGGSGGSESPLPTPSLNSRNAVIMGRKTWDSLPAAYRPLPNRVNTVLSRNKIAGEGEGCEVRSSLPEALAALNQDGSIRRVYVIGGAQAYAEALTLPACERIYITEIDAVFSCDTFFPQIPSAFTATAATDAIEENGIRYRFLLRVRH